MKKKRRRGNGEGRIFEDKKNKRWIGQYISGTSADGKAIRKSVYEKTQKEVLKKLNEIKYKMNNDMYVEKNGIELVKIMEDIREEKLVAQKVEDQFYNLKRELKETEKEQKDKISKIRWKTGLVTFLVGLLLSAIWFLTHT